jgi:hypothetical protein
MAAPDTPEPLEDIEDEGDWSIFILWTARALPLSHIEPPTTRRTDDW